MSERAEVFRENESAYFVPDRSNLEEMRRLAIHDKILTIAMRGVLPRLAGEVDFSDIRLGCGPRKILLLFFRPP